MDEFTVVLRIIHILAGAFWFGAALTFALFVEPSAKELGPAGGAFMNHLATKKRLPIVIGVTSLIGILAGVLLYWRASGGFESGWVSSDMGTAFTVGGAAAILAWLIGFTVIRPGVGKLGPLAQAAASGDASAGAALRAMQGRLRKVGLFNVGLLVLTVTAMSSARYL